MSLATTQIEKPESGSTHVARSSDAVKVDGLKRETKDQDTMCIDPESKLNGHAKVQENSPSDSTSEGPASNKSSEKMECSPGDVTQPTNPIRKTSTTTVSKFKEKRPEPLKLNPTLNQDIPLDLSVKSAGNVPSGTLSNIFNLNLKSQMTTLETPRIQWQDNDALLATGKTRLFSSSTNASQGPQISSLTDDSPPITPNTFLMKTMSPLSGTNLRSSANMMPHSASLVLESPSNSDPQRAQILDRWTKINQLRADLINGPRRSCSSDNLSLHSANDKQLIKVDRLRLAPDEKSRGVANVQTQINKKNSISPLATRSLSNTQNSTSSHNKFSYTNPQTASNVNDSQRSPTTNPSGKSLTPTSLANATANLLNIHLNSPTGMSQSPVTSAFDLANLNSNQRSPYKSTSFSAFDREISPLDPLISATFCQQHQFNSRTSSINFSSPSSTSDATSNFHRNMIAFQHQNLPSISGSATLNTPTLISPSQAGQLCFLQSPTLSPMSSVFDLPSPFLMFQHSSQNQHGSSSSKQFSPKFMATPNEKMHANDLGHGDEMQVDPKSSISSTISKSCDTLQVGAISNGHARSTDVSSANDLSRLITSATEKVASSTQVSADQRKSFNSAEKRNSAEIEMDCEMSDSEIQTDQAPNKSRPATTIPQICISNHQLDGIDPTSSKSNENMHCKRSLSPGSFRTQVQSHRNERLESSSAPPDVCQRRARSKIKTITADSCIDITYRNRAGRNDVERVSSGSASNITTGMQNGSVHLGTNYLHNRLGRHNPEVRDREWFPSSGQFTHMQPCVNGSGSQLGARSNSAEPAIYTNLLSKRSGLQPSFATNSNDMSLNCCQSAIQSNNGSALSSSAGQLHYGSGSRTNRLQEVNNSLNQTMVAGLNHSNMNSNQQIQHQYNSAHPYYSNQTNQDHSNSSGEVGRISNGSMERSTANVIAFGQSVINSRQNTGQFYKTAQETEQDFMRQNVPGISSSLNRVDYLLNDSHQVQVDPRRNVANSAMHVDPGLMMRQPSNQTSVINLLCNNETCQRQAPFVNNLQRSSTTSMGTPLTMAQHNQHSALIAGEISTDPVRMRGMASTASMRGMYRADLETRSDSRSSNSLDFSSQFLDGNSRPSSEASSNMTSKKYHCDQCSKSFTRSDMLTRHKRLHSGDRPFQCSECKQEFSRSDHLSTHMRTHTGEKPYKCKLCSYSACRKDMITRHLKVHSRSPHSNDFI